MKFRELGKSLKKTNAQSRQMPPRMAMEIRHEKNSVKMPMPTRPIMPPNAVPAIYSPMVLLKFLGLISSAIQAIATAGTPPRTKPSKLLESMRTCQLGETAHTTLSIEAKSIEKNMRPFLPNVCEKALDSTIDIAKKPVVNDSARALALGAIWKL